MSPSELFLLFVCFQIFVFLFFVLVEIDPHPRLVLVKLNAVGVKTANEKRAVHVRHGRHVIRVAVLGLQPALIKRVPQLGLRIARKALVVHREIAQVPVIVLAATLLGRLAATRVRRQAAAAASAAARGNPLVMVLAALVAERAVLPDTRITMLAPARRPHKRLLLRDADRLPLLRAHTLLRARKHGLLFIERIRPRLPLRDRRGGEHIDHLLRNNEHFDLRVRL